MIALARKAVVAVARNQVRRLLGGATRGGHTTQEWDASARAAHAVGIYDGIKPYLGSVTDKVGLEVGPGDNLDVCHCFIVAGARQMIAVERFAHVVKRPFGVTVLRDSVENIHLAEESIDFAYSHDVFEHVNDVTGAFRSVFRVLKPGGLFINSIDLRGHNSFKDEKRPLEHLTCPDWLYSLMHSHVITSNRVGADRFTVFAQSVGFEVEELHPLVKADVGYVTDLLPRVLPRWRDRPLYEIGILQLLLVLRKPGEDHEQDRNNGIR